MFVFNPGFIPPVRFGPGGTDPAEIYIPAVTSTFNRSRRVQGPEKNLQNSPKVFNTNTKTLNPGLAMNIKQLRLKYRLYMVS